MALLLDQPLAGATGAVVVLLLLGLPKGLESFEEDKLAKADLVFPAVVVEDPQVAVDVVEVEPKGLFVLVVKVLAPPPPKALFV